MLLTGKTNKWPLPFYKTTGNEFRKSAKLNRSSIFSVSFSRKSAPGRHEEFHRSVEKFSEVRIPRQIFSQFRCSANLDDPQGLSFSQEFTMALTKCVVAWWSASQERMDYSFFLQFSANYSYKASRISVTNQFAWSWSCFITSSKHFIICCGKRQRPRLHCSIFI